VAAVSKMKTYTIAVISGEGIGKEVVPEGLRVLEAVGAKFGIGFHFRHFDWSCEREHPQGDRDGSGSPGSAPHPGSRWPCHHKGTGNGHRGRVMRWVLGYA